MIFIEDCQVFKLHTSQIWHRLSATERTEIRNLIIDKYGVNDGRYVEQEVYDGRYEGLEVYDGRYESRPTYISFNSGTFYMVYVLVGACFQFVHNLNLISTETG